jgi:hypothetical protein
METASLDSNDEKGWRFFYGWILPHKIDDLMASFSGPL